MANFCLLLVLLLCNTCYSATFISENGILAEEEGTNNAAELGVDYTAFDAAESNIFYQTNPQTDSSSEEFSSKEESKTVSKSSESDESNDSSSSEEKRERPKRSLDSKQDSQNTINNANQTTKVETGSSKDVDETKPESGDQLPTDSEPVTITNDSTTEKSLQDENLQSSEVVESAVTESAAETTTSAAETETTVADVATTEADDQTTTETSEPATELQAASSTTPSTEDSSTETESAQQNSTEIDANTMMARVNKLSDQIRLVLKHYRNASVVVIPNQDFFPDPMPLEDFSQSLSVGKIDFASMKIYGLSNFTVEQINTDVDRMQVFILLHMKKLVVLGNYTLKTFWNRAKGPFNVTLLEVDSEGAAEVATADEGHLEATDSMMDMSTRDMRVDFKNLGFLGTMFQGAVGAVGDAIFNSIKPQILDRVNKIIRNDVNKKLKEFSVKFINKVAPVDLAFSEGRKYARSQGYDPYHTKDHSFLVGGLLTVNISDFVVNGLSRFYRVGNLSLSMDAGEIEIGVHVLTEKLLGHCEWSGETFGIVKSGKTNFTVDHLQVRALVTQSLDVRKKPQLKDLDMELGYIKVTMDSPMTLNRMIEGFINTVPKLIRHIIVDTLEEPLKEKVQEILDKINVESIVDENLPRLDSFGL